MTPSLVPGIRLVPAPTTLICPPVLTLKRTPLIVAAVGIVAELLTNTYEFPVTARMQLDHELLTVNVIAGIYISLRPEAEIAVEAVLMP